MAGRVSLLAGSFGPERTPARPERDDADWYLPPHLRDPQAARERIAAQVEHGADVVVAPTWLTHRRALLPLGETRRARDWTAAAVRIAREAVEVGLERRAVASAEAAPDDPARERPAPLVAASLPALDDDPEPGEGRLLPHEAATEREYREQAGWLADAEPDLILVEGQRSAAAARVALAEAVETGLPAWVALTTTTLLSTSTEAWLEWATAIDAARLLFPPPLTERLPAADGPRPWGALLSDPEVVADWLDAGAGAVAVIDGATIPSLKRMRAAVDDHERTGIEAARATQRRWRAHLQQAGAMAPGGAAAWIGSSLTDDLPPGFEWSRVDRRELPHLPEGRFRLVVDRDADVGAALARVLDRGGIVAARPGPVDGLRLISLDDSGAPPWAIYRRED